MRLVLSSYLNFVLHRSLRFCLHLGLSGTLFYRMLYQCCSVNSLIFLHFLCAHRMYHSRSHNLILILFKRDTSYSFIKPAAKILFVYLCVKYLLPIHLRGVKLPGVNALFSMHNSALLCMVMDICTFWYHKSREFLY